MFYCISKRLGVDADGKLWIGKDYTNWYLADIIDVEHPYIGEKLI